MTRDQARKKWCPMVRYCTGSDDNNAANRWKGMEDENIHSCNCIANGCMMWRECDGHDGFCGLAGKEGRL